MARNAASLMVSIGADISSFSKGIARVEKDAKRGFNTIRKAGEDLSLKITLPFVIAAGAMVKMAAQAEDASARVDRVFGNMASNVKRQLQDLAGVIPETEDAMQGMVVKTDNMLQGLGYGAEKAAKLSVNMLKLAGDMAAFARVPVSEALDALDKGMAGKTRGLIQFGIVVSANEIKMEAMRRGLLDNHRTLTELGTAEIAQMLIQQKATRINGEAARVAGQAGRSFAFLKRDVEELGDKLGGVLLPSVVALTRGMTSLVGVVSSLDPLFFKFAFTAGAVAATLGPLVVGIASLATTAQAFRLAWVAASGAAASFGTVIAGIASAPFAAIVTGIGLVTAALYAGTLAFKGYYRLGKFLTGGYEEDEEEAENIANDKTKTVLRNARHARLQKKTPDKLSQETRDALGIFKAHAALVQDQYQNAVETGGGLVERMAAINALHTEAVGLLASQKGKWTEIAQVAAEVARKTTLINDVGTVAGALARGTATPQLLGDASRTATSPAAIALGLAKQAIDDETGLRTREAALRMQNTFNATREATLQFGEEIRSATNDLALRRAKIKLPNTYDAAAEEEVNAIERMKAMYNDLADRAARLKTGTTWDAPRLQAEIESGEAQLAATRAIALRFETLLLPFDKFRDKLGNVSQAMQLAAVTMFDAAVSLAQNLAQQLAGKGKGAGIGGMIGSLLGGAVAGAKFGVLFGPLGAALGGIAGALVGRVFDHPAKAADQATQSLTAMAVASQQATNQLLNIPQGFKVALGQWRAQLPQPYTPSGGGSSGGGGGGGGGSGGSGGGDGFMPSVASNRPILLMLDGRVVAQSTLKEFLSTAQNTFGDSTRWPDLMRV